MWVQATKDFRYDDGAVGDVREGQVFELQGHVNDGGLLRHRLVIALDPQPSKDDLKHLPQCGECGRRFAKAWQRERCGRMHEMSQAELVAERREAAGQRLDKLREVGQIA